MSRRDFLGKTLLAGAGATVFEAFGATLPALADDQAGVDPGFIAGKVVSASSGELSILDPDQRIRRGRVGPSTEVWKQGLVNGPSIATGDCVYVRGTPRSDGVVAVDNAWVDIQSLRGVVKGADESSLSMFLNTGNEVVVRVRQSTRIEIGPDDAVVGSAAALSPGQVVQVVAFGDSHSGLATATDVFLLSDVPLSNGHEISPSSTTFRRISTWFCCGMVSGCGSGSCSKGGGKCGDCRTDRHHMAWPKVHGVVADCNTCNGLSCCTVFPQLNCGHSASVRNPCNDKTVNVTVHDCGPSAHSHSSVGCKDRSCVAVDLTACSFSAIGNLSAGLINVNVTV